MLQRLGFPPIGRHRRFVTALAIDAIGSGVWMPFEILFFLTVTELPMVQVGGAFSVGALFGIPASLAAGPLVDRIGPKPILVCGNLLLASVFAAAPAVTTLIGVVAVAVAASVANSMFWAAFLPMVAAIAEPGERERWFGFLGALRNVGFAAGGLGAAVVMSIGTKIAYISAAWLNAASFLFSAVLLVTVSATYAAQTTATDETPRGSLVELMRISGFPWFLAANLAYALSCLALNVAFPIYLNRVLGLPGWVAGAAFVVNTVLCGFGQGLVVNRMTGVVRTRVLQAGWAIFVVGYSLLLLASALPVWAAIASALIAVAVYSFGEMACGPVLAALSTDTPPEHLRGRAGGMFQMTWNIASIAAPSLFTWLLAGGVLPFWVGTTMIAITGAGVTLLLGHRLPHAAAPVTNQATSA